MLIVYILTINAYVMSVVNDNTFINLTNDQGYVSEIFINQ